MLTFHGVVLILLWLGADAKCGNSWTRARSASDVVNFGMVAGLYDTGIQSYVGRTGTGVNRIPARIQTDPLSFHYTFNMQNQMKRDGDYLKNNSDYDYIWVKANSKNCIDNAIMLDNTFFVGRTIVDGFTYLGNVMVGKVGLRYASRSGREIMVNDYEVLTCVEKTCSRGDLTNCEKRVETLLNDVEQLNQTTKRIEKNIADIKKDFDAEKANSALLRQFLEEKEVKLKACLGNCSNVTPNTTSSANSVIECPEDCEREKKNIMKSAEEQAAAFAIEIKKLEDEIEKINNSTRSTDVTPGVRGCLQALEALDRALTEKEMKTIIEAVKDKFIN